MSIRVNCLGGCETEVLPEKGECRKCRKARLRTGSKRLAKLGNKKDIVSRIKFFFASKKEQFQKTKGITWSRPKRSIRGLHIKEPRNNGFRF